MKITRTAAGALMSVLALGLSACSGAARLGRTGEPPAGPVQVFRVQPSTAAIGDYGLESVSRGAVTGRFTTDNPCRIRPLGGEYRMVGDTVVITIHWPATDPRQLCPDVVEPVTTGFQVEGLQPGPRWVVVQSTAPDAMVPPGRIKPPRRLVIR